MTTQEIHKIISDAVHKYKYCIVGSFSSFTSGSPYKLGKYKTIEAANDALYAYKKNKYYNLSLKKYFYGDYEGFYNCYYLEICEMFKYYKYHKFNSNSHNANYGFNLNEKYRFYIMFYRTGFAVHQDLTQRGCIDSKVLYKSSQTYNYEQLYDDLIIFKEFILPKYL